METKSKECVGSDMIPDCTENFRKIKEEKEKKVPVGFISTEVTEALARMVSLKLSNKFKW